MGKTIKSLLLLASLMLMIDQIIVMTDALAPALWSVFGTALSMLVFGFGLLFLGIDLVRDRVSVGTGALGTVSRVLILAGGGGSLAVQVACIFGMQLSYDVVTYVFPACLLVLCVGICSLSLDLKFVRTQVL